MTCNIQHNSRETVVSQTFYEMINTGDLGGFDMMVSTNRSKKKGSLDLFKHPVKRQPFLVLSPYLRDLVQTVPHCPGSSFRVELILPDFKPNTLMTLETILTKGVVKLDQFIVDDVKEVMDACKMLGINMGTLHWEQRTTRGSGSHEDQDEDDEIELELQVDVTSDKTALDAMQRMITRGMNENMTEAKVAFVRPSTESSNLPELERRLKAFESSAWNMDYEHIAERDETKDKEDCVDGAVVPDDDGENCESVSVHDYLAHPEECQLMQNIIRNLTEDQKRGLKTMAKENDIAVKWNKYSSAIISNSLW